MRSKCSILTVEQKNRALLLQSTNCQIPRSPSVPPYIQGISTTTMISCFMSQSHMVPSSPTSSPRQPHMVQYISKLSESSLPHLIAIQWISFFYFILSHYSLECQGHSPMSIIHQKNSETLVMTRFEGFHDPVNYVKVKGGLSIDMNFWTPCSNDRPRPPLTMKTTTVGGGGGGGFWMRILCSPERLRQNSAPSSPPWSVSVHSPFQVSN